ncbi:MAG: uroporphyrinogen decarboxylase family protein, partial [Candidatus Bathyarchaeia archaeon]
STPLGDLHEVRRKTVYGTSYYVTEYPVKGVKDIKIMEYILEQQRFEFDHEKFRKFDEEVGERTLPMVTLPHTPLMRLILDYMGFERTVKMLWRQREVVEELLKSIEENDAKMERIIRDSPFKLVNFGDNVHHDLCSPPLFERYMLPNYQRRTREMHSAGKFCVSHWDGRIGNLLPYIKETGLDGLECVTPKPQGDVTIEEVREAMDGLVLMDGLPAIMFLPWASDDELRRFVKRVIDLFAPRLILGIGDLLPPNGDIEKVRLVSELIEEYFPTPDNRF